ncbi:MAG: hypothetical protein HYV32_04455 [Candidatus Kerfeldbacteria bacterium]|nr:hypothetical protein [Candidatus Kerfeldbacteria bacterium]
MTLKRYIATMLLTTLLCWTAFMLVLYRIDPESAGTVGMMLFFISLFFGLLGTLNLLGFFLRFVFLRNTVPFRYIGISLRQSFWFALLVCLTLLLIQEELLVWWMPILLVLGLAVLEGFFLARSLEARIYQKKKLQHQQ